jgi:hypothetical protein
MQSQAIKTIVFCDLRGENSGVKGNTKKNPGGLKRTPGPGK